MKVTNTVFPLASAANRIALLCEVKAGTIHNNEFEAAVLQDLERRPYRKPVCAEGIYFPSVTEAAKTLVTMRNNRLNRDVFYRAVQSEVKRIARLCNEDTHEGYYWEA
jgi:hypothetical protein